MLSALLCLSLSAGAPLTALDLLALYGQKHDPGSVYLPADLYLVRATTMEAHPSPRETLSWPPRYPVGKFQITHVYLGPDTLKGKHFYHEQKPLAMLGPETLCNDVRVAFMEKGIEGLWWIRPAGPEGYVAEVRGQVVDAFQIRRFPYQNAKVAALVGGNARQEAYWREGLAWADAVEKVGKAADDAERGKLLCGYAAERSPVGAWAIVWLGSSKDRETVALLRELTTDDRLPFLNQILLDRTLASLDRTVEGPKWEGSQLRKDLWQRWRDLKQAGSPLITREGMDMLGGL
jgi:hypothetical protein